MGCDDAALFSFVSWLKIAATSFRVRWEENIKLLLLLLLVFFGARVVMFAFRVLFRPHFFTAFG